MERSTTERPDIDHPILNLTTMSYLDSVAYRIDHPFQPVLSAHHPGQHAELISLELTSHHGLKKEEISATTITQGAIGAAKSPRQIGSTAPAIRLDQADKGEGSTEKPSVYHLTHSSLHPV